MRLCVRVRVGLCQRAWACACAWVNVATLINHANRMRHFVMSFVAPVAALNFLLSHERRDLRKNVTEYKMCVLIFSTILFKKFLILRRIQRDIVINVKTSSCKVPVILVWFEWNLNIFRQIFVKRWNTKTLQGHYGGSRIVPFGSTDGRTDEQTDTTKLIVAFLNFANAPRKLMQVFSTIFSAPNCTSKSSSFRISGMGKKECQ